MTDAETDATAITIVAEIAAKITFATHQSNIPLIADLVIRNGGTADLDGLRLTMRATPPVVAERVWPIDRLSAGTELRIRDRGVALAGGLLAELSERMRADVVFELARGDTRLASRSFELTALARNEWGGSAHMPELLAAFSMPNDPAVQRLLKEASSVLERAGKESSLEGYQAKSRSRCWEIVAAIWAAVAARRLTYAEPPASFERQGQKIRTPGAIEEQGLATCLDTALLFAAAIEQAGLNAVVAFTKGHAFCGAWLQPQTLESLTSDDVMDLRKAVDARELVLFETTMATGPHPVPFNKAVDAARSRIAEDREAEFVYAVDIKQARGRQITPLPSLVPTLAAPGAGAEIEAEVAVLPALDPTPDLPGFDLGTEPTPEPDTPATRVEAWKRKLLDLTKRNRLLNLKPSATAIPIFCPDTGKLEDRLADDRKLTPVPNETRVAGDGRPDAELYKLRTGDDLSIRIAMDALERDQIVSPLSAKELESGLLQLYRKARTDLEEGGANTLFLALGMLRWRPRGEETRNFRAPLLLVPVKLERRGATSKLRLSRHDDEAVFNLTLIEMLRQDFGIAIPELLGKLPEDATGIDTARVWAIVRGKVRDVPGFEVVEEAVLSTFSFAKYLMWKDIADNTEALKANAFVRHLVETPDKAYGGSSVFLPPAEIDARVRPADLFMPLNADSSQMVAVHASGLGGDFVLEGPPGTGKSETIGNIIAHNLALGRRVLFVSEKMAALEVVFRRLRDRGLGDFCLELHSNRSNKREVVKQLGDAWTTRREKSAADWHAQAAGLEARRDELNGLVDALHRPGQAGISPRRAMGRVVRFDAAPKVKLGWGPDPDRDDRAGSPAGLEELNGIAHELGQRFAELVPEDIEALAGVGATAWSFQWRDRMIAESRVLLSAIESAATATRDFATRVGLKADPGRLDGLRHLAGLAATIPDVAGFDVGFGLEADAGDTFPAFEAALGLLERYRETRASLSTPHPDDRVATAPVEAWTTRWSTANASVWPLRSFRRWRFAKAMTAHFGSGGPSRPDRDLPVVGTLRTLRVEMEASARKLPAGTLWLGLDSDTARCRASIAAARRLREAALRLAAGGTDWPETREAVRRTFVDGRDMLAPGLGIADAGTALGASVDALERAWAAFRERAAMAVAREPTLAELAALARAVVEREARLKVWCDWIEIKRLAESRGLSALVDALEGGSVGHEHAAAAFETAYCRWLAPRLVDQREPLRRFSAVRHEDAIASFRALDKEVADLTATYIRARRSGDVPGADHPDPPPGFAILRREMQKKMRHKAVRQLVGEMGEALLALTPCLLMSPLSIAQFFPAQKALFDLVVFDEASQITVWDAVGAIARGKNVVIVGDPKQMPPTSFFDKSASGEDDGGDGPDDLESVLDEALSAGLRWHRLTGHYRSKHESLIAFSNNAYYDNQLVTFPAAETRASAVSLRRVEGVYGRSESRTNPIEAQAVVAEIVRRLRDPSLSRHSIGVVTLNSEQQRLVEDLLDKERRADIDLEPFFGDTAAEPVFVKNLETVQGDQRDVILLSVGYGPTTPGDKTMSMNFGPLNRTGGERRLNVAITRATTEVVVFASFDASMIDLTRTSAKAVHDLKRYLDFAQRGPVALAEAVRSVGGGDQYDSDFEMMVAEGLRKKGWTVHTQIGVSKFRVDLGIVHPDAPGRYLAGVECDGATYHASPTARDRDRVRHVILESLGWNLLRLWSTDYFLAAGPALDKLDAGLNALLDKDRAAAKERESTDASEQTATIVANPASPDERGEATDASPTPATIEDAPVPTEASGDGGSRPPMPGFSESPTPLFRESGAVLGPTLDAEIAPDRFHEPGYDRVVARLAGSIIDAQGPVTFRHLAEQIARTHGFLRTGSAINQRVWAVAQRLRRVESTPDGHKVFWPDGIEPKRSIPFRGSGSVERAWTDVPYPERLGLAEAVLAEASADPAALMARQIGLGRLSAKTRLELEELLALAAKSGGIG